MFRFQVPLKMLKVGDRHVSDNGDGWFWKDRWVVDEINEHGVISSLERYNCEKQEYQRDDALRTIIEWNKGTGWVLLDSRENPDFDSQDQQYQEWHQKWLNTLS